MSNYLLVVKRNAYELEVWKKRTLPPRQYRLAKVYPVAIGAKGYETEAGVYWVQAKARNPEWRMPDSKWVEPEDRGKVVPGGDPANPLVGSFLKLTDDGVGIHGTANVDSLGTKASHGCIRVREDVAIYLHRKIKKGTPVVIV